MDYLPRTTLDPPSTLAIYLAVEGLLVLPVFARAGHIADTYAPYTVAELSQYLNIASMAVLTCLLLLAAPSHPFVTLAVMALIQMTFMNRGILFDSAVMVIITTRVPEDKQPAFFTWNFRANLVTPLTAPLLGAGLFQHNVYVAIAVCATLSLVSALLLAWTRTHKVPSSAFADKPTLTVVRYAREFTRTKPRDPSERFQGFGAFRHLDFAGFILFLIAAEALGNRSRDSFDVFYVTDTFHQPATSFGAISVFMFIGMVIGTAAKSWISARWKQWWWPVVFYTIFAVSFVSRGFAPTIWVFFACCLIGGIFEVAWVSNTEKHYLGAVSAAKSAFFSIVSTCGYLVWAAYAWWGGRVSTTFMATHGYRIAYIVGGVLILVGAVSSIRLYRNVDWVGEPAPAENTARD